MVEEGEKLKVVGQPEPPKSASAEKSEKSEKFEKEVEKEYDEEEE